MSMDLKLMVRYDIILKFVHSQKNCFAQHLLFVFGIFVFIAGVFVAFKSGIGICGLVCLVLVLTTILVVVVVVGFDVDFVLKLSAIDKKTNFNELKVAVANIVRNEAYNVNNTHCRVASFNINVSRFQTHANVIIVRAQRLVSES